MSRNWVFWNSNSGKAKQVARLRQHLNDESCEWVDLVTDIDLPEVVQQATELGCQTIIAAGGDGTVNAIVDAMMRLDVSCRPSLAIIPLGTANDFAGTLGISNDLSAAVEMMRSTPAAPVDLVQVEGAGWKRHYANMAAGGNCVRASEAITDEIKERWGPFAYMRGAATVLPDMTSYRITAKCDDEVFVDLDSWAVLVANGKTNAGGIVVAPQASPLDGLLDVIIIRDGTMGDMIQMIANNLLGDFLKSEQVIFRQVRSLDLHSAPRMRFTLDGEIIDDEPIHFRAIPGAIRIHFSKLIF